MIRIDSNFTQRAPEAEIRSAAKAVDACDLTLQLFDFCNAFDRNDVIDESRDDTDEHHGICALKPGTREGRDRDAGRIDLVGEQRLQHCRARGDRDDFRLHALLLEELAIFHDPDRAIGRAEAGPGEPEPFLCGDGGGREPKT